MRNNEGRFVPENNSELADILNEYQKQVDKEKLKLKKQDAVLSREKILKIYRGDDPAGSIFMSVGTRGDRHGQIDSAKAKLENSGLGVSLYLLAFIKTAEIYSQITSNAANPLGEKVWNRLCELGLAKEIQRGEVEDFVLEQNKFELRPNVISLLKKVKANSKTPISDLATVITQEIENILQK